MKKTICLFISLFFLSNCWSQIHTYRMNNLYLQESVQEIEKKCYKKINWSEQKNIGHIKCSGVEFQLTFDEAKKLKSMATKSKNIRAFNRTRVGDDLEDLWFNYKKNNRIHLFSKVDDENNHLQEFELYSFVDETHSAYYSISFHLKNQIIEEIIISYNPKLGTDHPSAKKITSKTPSQEGIEIGAKIDDLWKIYSRQNLDIRIYHLPDKTGNLTRFKKGFYVFESDSNSVLKYHLSYDVVDEISIESFSSTETL